MPELATLLLFAASACALVAIPGPNHVLEGLVLNLLNPKVALFFLALLPQFVDPHAGPAWTQILVLGTMLAAIGLASDLLYALGAGRAGARLRANVSFARRRRYVAGAVYLALAAVALVGGRRRAA